MRGGRARSFKACARGRQYEARAERASSSARRRCRQSRQGNSRPWRLKVLFTPRCNNRRAGQCCGRVKPARDGATCPAPRSLLAKIKEITRQPRNEHRQRKMVFRRTRDISPAAAARGVTHRPSAEYAQNRECFPQQCGGVIAEVLSTSPSNRP